MHRTSLLTALVLLVSLPSMPLHAEPKKPNREREMIVRLQQNLQKSEQEKAALQQQKAAVDEQLKAADDKVLTLGKTAHRAAGLDRRVATLERDAAALRERLAEAEKQAAGLDAAKKSAEAENSRLRSQLARLEKDADASEAKNVQLYKYSLELLELYRHKGGFTSLAQAEPFTGLKRVEIDNLIEEYRDKLDAQKSERPAR